MGLISEAKRLIDGIAWEQFSSGLRYRCVECDAYKGEPHDSNCDIGNWLARYEKRGKVKVRVFQDPPTFWQWDCEECRVRSYALMSSRDAAIADAKMVAELLEIEIEIEGEADAH